MRFVTTTSCEAFLGSIVKVVLEERFVVRVGTLVDNDLGAVARAETT